MNNPNFDYQYRKLEDRLHEERERVRELEEALQKIVDATPANKWDVWPHHHFYLVTAREALAKHKAESGDERT